MLAGQYIKYILKLTFFPCVTIFYYSYHFSDDNLYSKKLTNFKFSQSEFKLTTQPTPSPTGDVYSIYLGGGAVCDFILDPVFPVNISNISYLQSLFFPVTPRQVFQY